MEAKKVVTQKEIEVVTKKLVDEETFTLTLTAEEASKLRTMSYTISDKLVKRDSAAHKLFWDIYLTLCSSRAQAQSGYNCESQFILPQR